MDLDTKTALVKAAIAARSNAYAPYSVYYVGAAVLSPGGNVFSGCNVENASYGLTVCAERNAIASMVSAGEKQVSAVAVATVDGAVPCGACLQVIAEFACEPSVVVYLVNENGDSVDTSLAELLPHAYVHRSRHK